MGTVVRVDSTKQLAYLDDGTIVALNPGGRILMGDRTLALNDLRPGDEIVISVLPAPDRGRSDGAGSALPRAALEDETRLRADEIFVMRQRVQAP